MDFLVPYHIYLNLLPLNFLYQAKINNSQVHMLMLDFGCCNLIRKYQLVKTLDKYIGQKSAHQESNWSRGIFTEGVLPSL